MKSVVVKSGDSLSKISTAVYGNSAHWKLLLNINKDKITNPNQIAAGMSLSYVDMSGAKATAAAPVKAKAHGKSTAKAQHKKSGSAAGAQQSE
jgi:LysM repeat protein